MYSKFYFLLCFFVSIILNATAQEQPPTIAYSPTDYKAENQNWSISQSNNKYIYIANNNGLLEFNGEDWYFYATLNGSIMRSVNCINDLIYTGSYMDFGYWQKDNFGNLNYTSLVKTLNIDVLDDEEFWNIVHLNEWILFQSLNRIYIYNTTDKSLNIINSDTIITKLFKVKNEIFYQQLNKGLYKLKGGNPVLVSNTEQLLNTTLVGIFEENELLILFTQEGSVFKLEDNKLSNWETAANNLKENNPYSILQLKDKSFAIGTISNGIIKLDSKGEKILHMNQASGLRNNTVLSLFEDVDKNLWLGLDNGINCLNLNSPFKIYNDPNGKLGAVYTAEKHNGSLYLGTNQGLYYKPFNSNEDFKLIENTQGQVWFLKVIENTLFCGHNKGTFIVNNNTSKLIATIPGTWQVKKINNNLLLQGNYGGLYILEKQNNTWQVKNKLEGFNISSRFFEILENNTVVVSHEYKGVFKLNIDSNYAKITSLEKDTFLLGSNSSLSKFNNTVYYTDEKGIFEYTNTGFKKDTLLSTMFTKDSYLSGKLVADALTDKLWSFNNKNIMYLSSSGISRKKSLNAIPLSQLQRNGVVSYEDILHLNKETYLLGTASGYITINLETPINNNYEININTISSIHNVNHKLKHINRTQEASFPFKSNNLNISYSVPNFNKLSNVNYQYKLEGIYNSWSSWGETNKVHFENLPSGDYIFKVRAKIDDKLTENIETFNFNIKRPWYTSNLLLVLYIISFIFLYYVMHSLYKNYYKRKEASIISKNQKELEVIGLENEKRFISLENEKLQQDIEGKNRELAISTMSLIKKNEFLSQVKDQLVKQKNSSEINIKSVIKLIDKNLNNTDDWKFFQEAFNNADKDFLKKVKSKHPSLTPNDLRLCAYLRLNLSSKEIAPLLNISHKSVEVKRYRLRKKMELKREDSLTNYILNL